MWPIRRTRKWAPSWWPRRRTPARKPSAPWRWTGRSCPSSWTCARAAPTLPSPPSVSRKTTPAAACSAAPPPAASPRRATGAIRTRSRATWLPAKRLPTTSSSTTPTCPSSPPISPMPWAPSPGGSTIPITDPASPCISKAPSSAGATSPRCTGCPMRSACRKACSRAANTATGACACPRRSPPCWPSAPAVPSAASTPARRPSTS